MWDWLTVLELYGWTTYLYIGMNLDDKDVMVIVEPGGKTEYITVN